MLMHDLLAIHLLFYKTERGKSRISSAVLTSGSVVFVFLEGKHAANMYGRFVYDRISFTPM